jgi:SAM-dependent methyltransferase
MSKPRQLNLGCGNDTRQGWINLDKAALPGVDIVHDLNKLPLPFDDNEFTLISCQDILEHLEYADLLREIHRILAHHGKVSIRVPHFSSVNNYIDPTHRKRFSVQSFSFFLNQPGNPRPYYFDFSFERIDSIFLSFDKPKTGYKIYDFLSLRLNLFLQKTLNKSYSRLVLFERSILSRLFTATNIHVVLRK